MDIFNILKEIGLSDAQIKVYFALLELGVTKSGPILKKTDLAGSVVYRALENLIADGLVNFVVKAKTKYFSATDPKNLLRLWEDKKEKLESVLPELKAKQKLVKEKQETKMYIGWKGIKTAFNSIFDILPKGSEYIAYATGVSAKDPENVKLFFLNFHRKRIAMNYNVKLIVNKDEKETFFKLYGSKKRPNLGLRFVDNFAPDGMVIFGNNVLIATFEEVKPIAIIISSKEIANSFRKMFYKMWKIAEK